MPFTISAITDEVSPDLGAGLRFAAREGLATVDIRSIDGVNFLSLEPARQRAVAREIKDAGLRVGCFATPLLKWAPPGRVPADAGDQFGFDAKGRTNAQLYDDAFAAAELLGTRNLRIFSFLTYAGFRISDLEPEYAALLERAERHGMLLHVENEPVCNVRSIPDLLAVMQAFQHPRLRALLDVGNAAASGAVPTAGELAAVMAHVDLVHFKDHTRARHADPPAGEGEVAYAGLLSPCLAAAEARGLALVIETHVPDDGLRATKRTLDAVRRLAGAIAA